MTGEERQLLGCLRAYRTGKPAAEITESLSPQQWRALYALAADHKLIPAVYEMLYAVPGFCEGDQSLLALWKQEAIRQAVNQAGRTQVLLKLTEELEREGILCVVVKGAVCRQLYRKPDLRPSGDEDLFVLAQERSRCGEIFAKMGLIPLSEQSEEDVEHWREPGTGLHIELHSRLLSTGWQAEEILNPYFEQQLLHPVVAPIEQGQVLTLNPTAHLLFLIAHALKHFIAGGFGVRTLADILSFCEQNESKIEKNELWEMLKRIHADVFFRQLLIIGCNYIAFDIAPWSDISSDCSDENDLLNDMMAAGVYGQTSMNRKHSAALVLQAAQGKQAVPSVRKALFPPISQMAGRYPVLRRMPVLLPALWICRICGYALELIQGKGKGNSPQEALALGKQRMEMMVKYGILPQAKTEDR